MDENSPGLAWIVGIFLLFIIGLGFVILNQVMVNYISPTAEDLINNNDMITQEEKNELLENNSKYLDYWSTLPFILLFLIIIFVIVAAVRHGGR